MASQYIGSGGGVGGIFQKGLLYPGVSAFIVSFGLGGKKSLELFSGVHKFRLNSTHVDIVLTRRRFAYMELSFEVVFVYRGLGSRKQFDVDQPSLPGKYLIMFESSPKSTTEVGFLPSFFLFFFFFDPRKASSSQQLPTKPYRRWFIQPSMRSNQSTLAVCSNPFDRSECRPPGQQQFRTSQLTCIRCIWPKRPQKTQDTIQNGFLTDRGPFAYMYPYRFMVTFCRSC